MVAPWSSTEDGWAVGLAARALGALRMIRFPTHHSPDGWLFELEERATGDHPMVTGGVAMPTRAVATNRGVVWIFGDRSGLALRRSRSGLLHLPSWPLFSETWTDGDVHDALGERWRAAPRGPRSEAEWCAPPNPLDCITPWCPAVSVPPRLWKERLHALDLCRTLLWERWQGHPGAILARSQFTYVAIFQHGRWRSDLPPSLSSPMLSTSSWAMAKHPGDVNAVRTALERAAQALFPGRLGFAADLRPGASLHHGIVPQPFLTVERFVPAALSAHQRLHAQDVLQTLGAWDTLLPFLGR